MKSIFVILFILALCGCTDAELGGLASYGDSADVTCYSGGEVVYEAQTTGKVANLEGGGWAFKAVTGEYVKTFADCFVEVR